MFMCVCITKSFCCRLVTKITLQFNHTSIKTVFSKKNYYFIHTFYRASSLYVSVPIDSWLLCHSWCHLQFIFHILADLNSVDIGSATWFLWGHSATKRGKLYWTLTLAYESLAASQWFSTWGDLAPQGTCGNVWRHTWLSQVCKGCN